MHIFFHAKLKNAPNARQTLPLISSPPNHIQIRLDGASDRVFTVTAPHTRLVFDDPKAVSIKIEHPYSSGEDQPAGAAGSSLNGTNFDNQWLHGSFWLTDDAQTWQVSEDGRRMSGEYTKTLVGKMRHTVRWDLTAQAE